MSAATAAVIAEAVRRNLADAAPEVWLGLADRLVLMGRFKREVSSKSEADS